MRHMENKFDIANDNFVINNEKNVINLNFRKGDIINYYFIFSWNKDIIKNGEYKLYFWNNLVKEKKLEINCINDLIKIFENENIFNLNLENEYNSTAILGSGVEEWCLEIKINNKYNKINAYFLKNTNLRNVVKYIFNISEVKYDELIKPFF